MNEHDLNFVRELTSAGVINGPILELGASWEGMGDKRRPFPVELSYRTTDLAGEVDYIANFESGEGLEAITERFQAILILNVLEHTFEPIKVLDNALRLLAPGGILVTATPAVWPIHNFPIDCCRLLPDFYMRYAESRGLILPPHLFRFLGHGPITTGADGLYHLPKHVGRAGIAGIYIRLAYRAARLLGRGAIAIYPYVSIGAVLSRRPI